MNLTVNGKSHEHNGDGSLLSLIEEMGAKPARVAVMVNDAIVGKDRDSFVLTDGDRVEILTLAGGG